MSSIRFRVNVMLAVVALACTATAVVVPQSASAAPASVLTQHVYNTGGEGLYLHLSDPTLASATYGYVMGDGTEFDVACWAPGDDVNGDAVWDYGTDADTGDVGYAADFYIDTPVSQGSEGPQLSALGVPQCGTDATGGSDGSGGSSGTASSTPPASPLDSYNRNAAVDWARAHAQDNQAYGAMCTWFVSQALWAGGLAKSDQWTDAGSFGSAPGTKTAWQVQPLLTYVQQTYSTTWEDITANLSSNAVPDAQAGDIIAYDWGQGEGISHLAFVDDLAAGNYPEVSEMGQFDWNLITAIPYHINHPNSPYVQRGWTWSAISNPQRWLQEKFPAMHVYLLHFNGGYLAPTY